MALARWQATITDEAGNVIPSASVEVRAETGGAPLVSLFSDRDGLVSISNPFNADLNGFAGFHVAGGAYQIRAFATGFARIWRYVAIGTASEFDFVAADVVGPASAKDRALALYSGTTGKLIKDGPALGTSGHPLLSGGAGVDPSFAQLGSAGLGDNAVTDTKIASSAVTTAKLANNGVTNFKLADMAAFTLKMRNASTTGDPTDGDVNALTDEPAPADGDLFLLKKAGAGGAFRKVTASNAGASANARTATIVFVIDGGGVVIPTGVAGDLRIEFGCTIQSVTLLADQTGSIVVDIFKDTLANFPPVVADSITASAKPTITSSNKSEDTTLTGWTTAITAGDILRFNVDSVTTIQRCTVILEVLKS